MGTTAFESIGCNVNSWKISALCYNVPTRIYLNTKQMPILTTRPSKIYVCTFHNFHPDNNLTRKPVFSKVNDHNLYATEVIEEKIIIVST